MNNRTLTLYTARSRKDAVLQETPVDVEGLFARLSQSQALPVTHGEYMGLRKPQQDDMKDVGGHILGELKDGRRRNGCVLTRCAAVLDADNIPAGCTEDFIRRVAALGACCCIHSTAKHSPYSPRLRVVIPFSEDIPAEQYAPVVRLLCQTIHPEMAWFDPASDKAGQLMYNPSHCKDVTPVYQAVDGPFLDAAALLDRLLDWKDPTAWPRFPRETAPAKLAAKQQDPESKTGIVGAFCRAYDVPAAMDKFLPGVYEATGTEGRYTFAAGSTSGGAVVYEGGKFVFSHHATDPCGGLLVNAWDLVRLHLFADLDDEVVGGNKGNTLPSFKAMYELAGQDEAVKAEQARAAFNEAAKNIAFQNEDAALVLASYEKSKFDLNVLQAALNAIGTKVRRNLITGKLEIVNMPAAYSEEGAPNILPVLLWDKLIPFQIKGASITAIQKGMSALADENRYNPVLDMLHTTAWDGTQRFHTLAQILQISSGSFYALLLRKWLIQCVALIHNTYRRQEAAEGVLVLQGEQGIGKTTFLRRMAIKSEWLAEGVTLDMRNKDSLIRATSVWIAELGELESTLKKEQTELKSFITQKVDSIRAPYAAEHEDKPRHTSFGATVNQAQFLKDETGDRRFFVIPLEGIDLETLLALPDDWFIQLWAEAYIWWQQDPQGFRLSTVEKEHLKELNSGHREMLPAEEEIRLAFNWDLPREQWGQFTPTQLKKARSDLERATPQQIGRALVKLAVEDKRIEVSRNTRHKVNTYTLPILPLFSSVADTAGTAESNSNEH